MIKIRVRDIQLIVFLFIPIFSIAQENDTAKWKIKLDTVAIYPFPNREQFKDAFLSMPIPYDSLAKRVYPKVKPPEPTNFEESMDRWLVHRFYPFPGVVITVTPAGTAITGDIDVLYNEYEMRRRKRKRTKLLPKFH